MERTLSKLVWQRAGNLELVKDHWEFRLQSMYVGRQYVPLWPHWCRPTVEKLLGEVDQVFADQFKQFTQLPDLELKPNDSTKHAELRLYTYSDTNLLHHAQR